MRAFVVTKYKAPPQEADVPEPVVGEHDVLVRVEAAGLNPLLRVAVASLSRKMGKQAKKYDVTCEFLFMRARGEQLRQVTALIDQSVVCPVVGKVVGFDQTAQGRAVAVPGRIRGKTVIVTNHS